MKLINKLRSIFNSSLSQSSAHRSVTKSWESAWLTGREDTLPAQSVLRNAFEQSAWIYACVTTLAECVSSIPFRIVRDDSPDQLQTGDFKLQTLFDHPHPQLDRFAFWELIVSWLCLRGEAFILPISSVPSAQSAVSSFLILTPDHFQEIISNHELIGWRYLGCGPNGPASPAVLLPEEVVHIRLPNPFHFWRGMSPLAVGWVATQTDYAAAQFMKGAMLNNADTGLIVTTEQQLSPEEKEQVLAALRERKRGAGSADRPLFLSNGARVEKPTITAMDLQFLENRKFNRQEICAIFKVPQELLGFTEDANRSVSEAARLNFIENRIAPLCKRLEAGIQPIIDRIASSSSSYSSSKFRGEFQIKTTPVMQSAQRARIDSGTKLFGLGVPLNVVNTVLDLGLPRLPHGDTSFLSSRFKEVTHTESPEPAEEIAPEAEPAERCLRLLSALSAPANGKCKMQNAECGILNEVPASGGSHLFEQTLSPSPRPLGKGEGEDSIREQSSVGSGPTLRKLSRFLFGQRTRVLAALEKAMKWEGERPREPHLFAGSPGVSPSLLDVGKEDQGFAALFGIPAGGFNRETYERLQAVVADAIARDEDFAQIAARVKAFYNSRANALSGAPGQHALPSPGCPQPAASISN